MHSIAFGGIDNTAMSFSFPLTAMEEFFFWDDRPAYPCDCFVHLRFSGCLDRAALERAVPVALARHPMLRATIEIVGRRRLRWTVLDNPAPRIVWEAATVGPRLPPATHIDLQREIGIRFYVRIDRDTAASDVSIQFHHACSDAAGIASFVRDLLIVYGAATGQADRTGRADKNVCPAEDKAADGNVCAIGRLPPLDPALLAGRGRFGLTFGKLLKMAPRQLVGLLGARQFLQRQPVPVLPYRAAADDSPLPAAYPATLRYVFDRPTTAGVRRAALRHGVTPNDLLARDLFLSLGQWRERQNASDGEQWLRMMVPMNLRTLADLLLPAANVVSSVFLDRREPYFTDPAGLLRGIHAEMELIKRNQLGFTFVFSLAACRRLFGSLEKQVRADKCSVSCVFTNVGNFFAQVALPRHDGRVVAGNVTLLDVNPVGPIHPYACVTFVSGLYADELGITLHYDPRPVSEPQAADLLADYVERIRGSADL